MQRGLLQNLLFGGHYELFGETLGSLGVLGKDLLNSHNEKVAADNSNFVIIGPLKFCEKIFEKTLYVSQ